MKSLLSGLTALAVTVAVSAAALAGPVTPPTNDPPSSRNVTNIVAAPALDCGPMFEYAQVDPTDLTKGQPLEAVVSPSQIGRMFAMASVREFQITHQLNNATFDAAVQDMEFCLAHPITVNG